MCDHSLLSRPDLPAAHDQFAVYDYFNYLTNDSFTYIWAVSAFRNDV